MLADTEPDPAASAVPSPVAIRRAVADDLAAVIALDERVTGIGKPEYWQDIFERYSRRRPDQRFFLVAEKVPADEADGFLGFAVGEVRAWEFGSEPCGWVFAISVSPETRLRGVGKSLFRAMAAQFREVGITVMRTMVARDNPLHMAFFRSEGMSGGPYLQLEMDLMTDPDAPELD
ncbi:MAG: GNAT family N-acetyltransferase [Pseudomonadota bacterium]